MICTQQNVMQNWCGYFWLFFYSLTSFCFYICTCMTSFITGWLEEDKLMLSFQRAIQMLSRVLSFVRMVFNTWEYTSQIIPFPLKPPLIKRQITLFPLEIWVFLIWYLHYHLSYEKCSNQILTMSQIANKVMRFENSCWIGKLENRNY